jgi:Protein of unknown function (DUF3108)
MSMGAHAFKKASYALCVSLTAITASSVALAQSAQPTQISIRYNATLSGLYVGSANLRIALTPTAYNIEGSGSLSGVLKNLIGFKLNVNSYGTLSNNAMIPQRYTTEYGTAESSRSIKIDYSRARKAIVSTKPPFFPSRSRVALRPEHLKRTIDPLSALFLPVKKNQTALAPENCQRLMPVFDGRMRYDLEISSAVLQKSRQTIRGFSGPVLICQIRFLPIAGYSKPKGGLKKPEKNNQIEIWLTPMGSAGLLIPIKGRLPTPFGMAEISIRRLYLNGQKVAAL